MERDNIFVLTEIEKKNNQSLDGEALFWQYFDEHSQPLQTLTNKTTLFASHTYNDSNNIKVLSLILSLPWSMRVSLHI